MSRARPGYAVGPRAGVCVCILAGGLLGCGAPQVVGEWASAGPGTGSVDISATRSDSGSAETATGSSSADPSTGTTGASVPASRDPFLWPFDADSIWNRPIGDEAVYVAANLDPAPQTLVEQHRILRIDPSDPERTTFASVGPDDRCRGDVSLELPLRVPDDWLVLPRNGSNDFFTALRVDGDTLLQGHPVARCEVGGPLYFPAWMQFPDNQGVQSIRGDGTDGGGVPPSGLSYLGGTIRLGELTSDAPVRHAIKFSLYGRKYVHYSDEVRGFRWPAKFSALPNDASNYEPEAFGRESNPQLVFGTLLAIPPELSPAGLGLATAPGLKLFHALQDYGGYLTASMANDTWAVHAEYGVADQVEAEYGFSMIGPDGPWQQDLNRILPALMIIDDNAPDSIGGAGARRAPPAPPFDP